MSIKVLIVDDHKLFRQGLHKLLEMEDDIDVVEEADDGLMAVDLVRKLHPDVVLMDMKMPKINGVAATRMILAERPETGIIVLTMLDGDAVAIEAIRAGARGYVLKTADSQEVAAAIHAVHRGASLLDPMITGKVLDELRRISASRETQNGLGTLTDKEVIMLRLLSKGLSNRAIAMELHYSESTVKNRLSTIFDKICVADRTQAAVYAITHGLCSDVDQVVA